MRHCCSVSPCWRSEGRNCRITASRARSSDIGKEREKSRIGTRRADAPDAPEPELLAGFLRAMVDQMPWSLY
jgi:hypothetical protein